MKKILLFVVLLSATFNSIAQQFVFKTNQVDTWDRKYSVDFTKKVTEYYNVTITFNYPYAEFMLPGGKKYFFEVIALREHDDKKTLIMDCKGTTVLFVHPEHISIWDGKNETMYDFKVYSSKTIK